MDTRHQLDQLLDAALDLPTEDLPEFLSTRCPEPLRGRLAELLDLREDTTKLELKPISEELLAEMAKSLSEGASELETGQQVGPWSVLGKLGEGGMGCVYLVESADGRRAALKIASSHKERIQERIRFEREVLAALEDPGTVRYVDGGEATDGRPYLVMELARGEHIDSHCDARLLTLEERLRLFCELCRAVEAVHRAGVVHRDLKPANILVSEDGRVKLLDFGIAKRVDTTIDCSEKAVEAMTPDYSSPEQFLGGPVTEATDVYQLGVLLYRLLTGELPYSLKGRLPYEVMETICGQSPRWPSRVFAGSAAWDADVVERARLRSASVRELARALGELDGIVLEALAKEPEDRFASVRALRAAVEAYLEGGEAPLRLAA